ncbi:MULTISPECIES: phospholipase A [Citromicrobium]|uniref:phospholipase A n=1 Tax=Citromicrobium TaxID=72173 RepID=UPI0001DD0F41|nr:MULTISPECIES: phospholipase A [Citromicrobium]ALG60491.1 phospholipase A [Citromicrobium sp. JL477]
MMCRLSFPAALAIAIAAVPAMAQDGIETLIGSVEEQADNGTVQVTIRVLNGGDAIRTVALPDRVEAWLSTDDDSQTVWLKRTPAMPASVDIAPGGFASAHYRLSDSAITPGTLLSVPAWGGQRLAVTRAISLVQTERALQAQAASALPTPPASDRSVGNAFLENLSAYEPIYAVYGPSRYSEARIQLSFRYQLFGSRAREDRPSSLTDGLYFAYTQRMFWDLGADSSPFRNIDYQPEFFYLSPPVVRGGRATVSAQIGLRHESNGRDGDASRSLNTAYIAPMAAFSLGNEWRLTVAPRLWLFAGDRSENPDIRRYRGNTGLFVEVGHQDGVRLTSSSRFNFSSGKGAVSADLSYPLRHILGGGPDFYLFGQSYLGYGENLLDYDRHVTRFRVGLALVR